MLHTQNKRLRATRLSALATMFVAFVALVTASLIVFPQPSFAATAEARDPLELGRVGYMISPYDDGKAQLWLGTQAITDSGSQAPAFCTQMVVDAPRKSSQILAVDTLSDPLIKAPSGLALTTPQMAFLLNKYQYSDDPVTLAALSYLVHANYENGDPRGNGGAVWIPGESLQGNVEWMVKTVQQYGLFIDDRARTFVSEAVRSGSISYSIDEVVGEAKREGVIKGLRVINSAGDTLSGRELSVTLDGPAVFDETGSNTWKGKSQADPLSLAWHATGNGEVKSTVTYASVRKTLRLLNFGTNAQNTLTYGGDDIAVDMESAPGPSWNVIFDFQPMGESHVQKISDDKTIVDTFEARADSNYGGGEWMLLDNAYAEAHGVEPGYVPVTYTVSAYYVGDVPDKQNSQVPSSAQK